MIITTSSRSAFCRKYFCRILTLLQRLAQLEVFISAKYTRSTFSKSWWTKKGIFIQLTYSMYFRLFHLLFLIVLWPCYLLTFLQMAHCKWLDDSIIIHGASGKSTSFPKRKTWSLGMWTAFWFPQSRIFSKFLHWWGVLKSGYGSLKPLQEASDIFAQEEACRQWAMDSKFLPDPFVSNHTNIGRTHEVLTKYFHTMICECDLGSQFAQQKVCPYLDAYEIPLAWCPWKLSQISYSARGRCIFEAYSRRGGQEVG